MSNFLPGEGVRDVYVKDSGDNDNDGSNIIFAVADLPTAKSKVEVLDPPPALTAPASMIDSGASRYPLTETFEIPDNVQTALEFSSIAADSTGWTVAGTLIRGGANSQASILTISTSGLAGDVAYSTNGKSRLALTTRAMILNGQNQIGSSIDGASDETFQDIGQALARFSGSTILDLTATGNKPRYYQYNEINVESDNCTGFHCDTSSTGTAAFRVGAITYETSPIPGNGTGAGCIGFDVDKGSMAGYCVEANIETIADVDVDGDLILDNLVGTGDIIVAGKKNYSARRFTGDITVSGNGIFNIDEHDGDLTSSGNTNYRSIKLTGDIVNSGNMTITVDEHIGSITNSGILNGMINGIRYGTWDLGTEFLSDFFRNGNIPNSYDPFGFLQIDTTAGTPDEVNSIIVRYQQNTSQSRTIDFQLIDGDDSTVYIEGTNTVAAIGQQVFEAATVINTFPSRVVNLVLQIRDNGGQVSDGAVNMYYTRNN